MTDVLPEAIAIIGAAGRFPQSRNLAEFWQRLQAGQELVTFFSDEELLAAGVEPALLQNPNYVKARAVLEDAELFDALFFGINPREAEVLDPQQRVLLETAWEALEDAAYDPQRYAGAIGVYAGLSMNSYIFNNLLPRPDVLQQVGPYQLMLASDKDFAATRVAYKLNLRGPSVTVQTACSTSLVAVQMACQSLLTYQCDIALAGGVSVSTPRVGGYVYQPGMILSPDGHCRPFDARGRGIVAGEGAGVVVLKRLSEALADGDAIRAVILGAAINNDGADKVGYTAPSVQGQAEVIAMAQAMARVSPDTIQVVEAHGTGTELGDPIEIAALTQAFRLGTERRNFCALGSVKSNMGHLDAAAGVAGLLKTMLALEHGQIPPSLHFETPNPNIDFADSPFYVAARLADWPRTAEPRRAGVSSFGIGGTNAHVVVEEAPVVRSDPAPRRRYLLLLSALTASALDKATAALAEHLAGRPELDLADVAYTLQVGRRTFSQRRFVVCADRDEAITRLRSYREQALLPADQGAGRDTQRQPVAFLFPGQGAQYAGMGRELYATEPLFRSEVDACAELLLPHVGLDLRELLFPPLGEEEAAGARLRQTALTQPALFVVEYALARLWMAWGVEPEAMIGHSIGEYVAACLAGVFSLADGLALVAARGRLMQSLPPGSMLAVPLASTGIAPYLGPELALAAVNAPQMCVVAGETPAVEALEARLLADGVQCQRLHTSHAFHSAMMDPILDAYAARVAQVELQAPARRYVSNVTGTWITAEQATDPRYWAQHLRSTVRFSDGLGELLSRPGLILLEVGPGRSLAALAKQHSGNTASQQVIGTMRHPHDHTADDLVLLQALGRLWQAGAEIDWPAFYAGERRRRVALPTYSFERVRFWVDGAVGGQGAAPAGGATGSATGGSARGVGDAGGVGGKRADPASWFYVPSWRRLDLPLGISPGTSSGSSLGVSLGTSRGTSPAGGSLEAQNWLLFADGLGLADQLADKLRALGHGVTTVVPGPVYGQIGDGAYQLAPAQAEGYAALVRDLQGAGRTPDRIVHLWNAGGEETSAQVGWAAKADRGTQTGGAGQELAFYSLLYLAQALAQLGSSHKTQLDVVATGLHDVTGDEPLNPAKALLLGPCRVIAQEMPQVVCRSIDIVLPATQMAAKMEAQLWAELNAGLNTELSAGLSAGVNAAPAAPVVALRGGHRWVQSFAELTLGPAAQIPQLLRSRGVYLITGGLGGIGLAVAELLARTVQARLVLTARTALPPRAQWPDWLAEHAVGDPLSKKIAAVQALEARGAEVLVCQADVTDLAQMEGAVAAAHAAFGAINGAIHAAGVAGGGIIPLKTQAATEAVLAPKVVGTANLGVALGGDAPDFVVLCSSFTSILGGVGQIDYTAANAYLDAYAQAATRDGGPLTIAVNWATWQEVGMAFDTEVPAQWQEIKEENLRLGLSTAEGQECFWRILANPLPQVVVSPQDLQVLVLRANAPAAPTQAEEVGAGPAGGSGAGSGAGSTGGGAGGAGQADAGRMGRHARPALQTAYVAPRNELEAQLAEVWEQLFGIDAIGIHDNFFELGGHSLLATQILVRLQDKFGVALPVRVMFESHTIAELGGQLELMLWAAENQRRPVTTGDPDREEVEF